MVYDYLISLKRPDYKIIDLVSQLLYLVAFATFIFFATKSQGIVNGYWLSALILLVIFLYLKFKIARKKRAYYTAGLAIAAITFLAGPNRNLFIFFFYVASLLIERELKFHKEIGFTEKEIVFNTLISKQYDWADMNNVLIKDGLLTLDFKNNKVIQKEIEGDVSKEIEQEFNSFCIVQVEYSR
ncbi:MAG: hypothetical protein LH478_10540 [Chitinophagaceae bacterium]|nr:hypothetical protein [Chitinophagaceae bacterium]